MSATLDRWSVYLPQDRRHAMAAGLELPQISSGAALFADISGFTPLAEALVMALGPRRGAEALTAELNRVYDALIAEVDRYGGSVISFSGDAITCWFDSEPIGVYARAAAQSAPAPQPLAGPQAAAQRAAACALAMQYVMHTLRVVAIPGGAAVSLAIKVALAQGMVRRFQVGDPQLQYIDTLAGATLDRLAAGERQAQRGEVIAAEDLVTALGAACVVRQWRIETGTGERFALLDELLVSVEPLPWPELAPGALQEEQVRPWLMPAVAERLALGQDAFLAELRPAVALFARFSGIDYDGDPQAARRLDAYIRWSQRVLARYEGSLLQLTIGDKGSYFYGVFGAPTAHDDDAQRAVAAALELAAPPEAFAYIGGVQIGVNSGRMRTGPYGGKTRRTYGILGDDVNLAARLMSRAAPGQVLVSERIARIATEHFQLRSLGEMYLKGKAEPAPVSLVVGRRGGASRQSLAHEATPLIGRAAELGRISEQLAVVRAGSGVIVRVIGVAGIGKSHLAAGVLAVARQLGFQTASGVCQSTTTATSYMPWRQAFRSLMNLPDENETAQVAAVEQYIARMGRDWAVRLPLLGDLLGLPIPDNATTAAFEPRLRQSALIDLALEILRAEAAHAPLLLLIDDAHWIDETSRGLTLALGRALGEKPIALLLLHRPRQSAETVLPELNSLPYHLEIALDELSAEGIAELARYRLGGPVRPLALALIQLEAQGNPFFVTEVIETLRETGHLYQRADGHWFLSDAMFAALREANGIVRIDGLWQLAPAASLTAVDLGLPDSIQGAVLARIDRLPESHKLTLKVASVIGRTFNLDLLGRIHPSQPGYDDLLSQIDLLDERDFTRLDLLARLIYAFKHTVTHEVAYETLLFDQRRELHRFAAVALERLVPEAIEQIAHHAFAGADWRRALRYQANAGRRAQRIFANHESAEHFRKALRCAEELPDDETAGERLEIHRDLGQVLGSIGQYDAALDQLRQALDLAARSSDADASAAVCRWTAYVHELRGDFGAAQTWIQRGLDALGARETDATAELYAIAALISTRRGDYQQAMERCEASIRIALAAGRPATRAFAYNARAVAAYRRGDLTAAIDDSQRALELYSQADNIQGQAMSCNEIGNAYFDLSQWTAADRYYRRAREIFNQTGDLLHLVFADNNLAEIARYQGRLEEARGFYQEAIRLIEQIGGSPYVRGVLLMNLGATNVRIGEVAIARRYLGEAEHLFAEVEARDFLPELYRHLADAALTAGELDVAEREGLRAIDEARALEARGAEGSALRVLGDIARARADLLAAERLLLESQAILDEQGDAYEAARARLALARVYLESGRAAEAQDALAASEATFERLAATLDLALARALRP